MSATPAVMPLLSFNPFDLSQLIYGCSSVGANNNGCTLDKSVEMLGDIFGTLATQSIPGGGMATNAPTFVSLFSEMIGYFNLASVGIITLIFGYIIFMSTINSAHEGVAFGRQHNATYTLLRAILGPVLMFPIPTSSIATTAGGGASTLGAPIYAFSTLQAIIMKLVLIGVNMANIVWNHTMSSALGMPPTQMPGPVNTLVGEQVGKLYLYNAVFKMMGITLSSGANSPSINFEGGQEYAPDDPVLYQFITNYFINQICPNAVGPNGNGFVAATSGSGGSSSNNTLGLQSVDPIQTCVAAVNKMITNNHAVGVIYPLSSGRSLSGTGSNDVYGLDNSGYWSPYASMGGSSTLNTPKTPQSAIDPRYYTYLQYQFSFGQNAPYYNDGLVNVQNMQMNIGNISSVATTQYNAATSEGNSGDSNNNSNANPYTGSGDCSQPNSPSCYATTQYTNAFLQALNGQGQGGQSEDPLYAVLKYMDQDPTTQAMLNNSVSSIVVSSTANTAKIMPFNCSIPGGTDPVDQVAGCDMSSTVDALTNSLIQAVVQASQLNPMTLVPGTGATCNADKSITSAQIITMQNGSATQGSSSSDTPTGPFGTEPALDGSGGALCVRPVSYADGSSAGKAQQYILIPGQNYALSWWYGSEVYLDITQKLADNIKKIAQLINQFAISDSSLQIQGAKGTKVLNYRAWETIRSNFGHNPFGMYVLNPTDPTNGNPNAGSGSGGGASGLAYTAGFQDAYSAFQYGNGDGPYASIPSELRNAQSKTIEVGPSGDLQTTSFVAPAWESLTCVFQPGTSFLNAHPPAVGQLGASATPCYSTNSGIAGSISNSLDGQNHASNTLLPNGQSLYDALENMPEEYRMPISILILWELEDNLPKLYNAADPVNSYNQQLANVQAMGQMIANMIGVLQLNHVYPGSQSGDQIGAGVGTAAEIQPASKILNLMFDKVLGQNQVGAMNLNNNLTGLMSDIYSIGNQVFLPDTQSGATGDPTQNAMNAVMASSYNNIAQVQQVGLEMINTVVYAIQTVYQEVQTVANQDIASDHKIYELMKDWAYGGAAGSTALGFFSPQAGQLAATMIQIRELAYTVVLQYRVVSQSFQIGNMLMWLPLIITVCTSLFTAGISFALIVPIMPFILYWSGQISWLLGVMEAIIAAPLLCLAWTTPGGHSHMGHTLGGIKILIGIIFRPVLMVIGLFAALILTFVLIKYSSQAFQLVSSQILSFAGSMADQAPTYWNVGNGAQVIAYDADNVTEGTLAVLMLLLFTSLIVMAFTKCYSMIYAVPERVLGWIGVQVDRSASQDMEKLTGSVTQQAGQAGQAAGSTLSQGAQTQSSHMSQSGSADIQAGQSQQQMATSASGAVQSKPKQDGGGSGDAASAAEDAAV